MLSDALKLYFKALERQLFFQLSAGGRKIATKDGFIAAYQSVLGEILVTEWSDCPAKFEVVRRQRPWDGLR